MGFGVGLFCFVIACDFGVCMISVVFGFVYCVFALVCCYVQVAVTPAVSGFDVGLV